MSFKTSSCSEIKTYALKSYADFRSAGAGATIRLRRIDADGAVQTAELRICGTDSVLADPADLAGLEAIVYLASRPNMAHTQESQIVHAEVAKNAAHKELLDCVLAFRAGGAMPGVVGKTGVEFRVIPPTGGAGAGVTKPGGGGKPLSAMEILAAARAGKSAAAAGATGTAFSRRRLG
jgi:hypothetical protein